MEIKVTNVAPDKMKAKPADESQLGFGKIFSDHFFNVKYHAEKGWFDAAIEPYRPLEIDPAAMCLHYGQEIFEGMKAYRGKDGAIYLFRPMENIRRMNVSAERLCMPPIDEELFLEGITKLVLLEKDWIPRGSGTSLYIRPTMIATEKALGVHPANEYLFFIIVGPVGAYYPQGFSPTKIYVSEEYVRAAIGGVGYCKAAGNYAASLLPHEKAVKEGFADCIYLDPLTHTKIEEVGAANFFGITKDNKFITPKSESILPSITKYSLMHIAKEYLGMEVEERDVLVDKLDEFAEAGACGTAAVITPIGGIEYKGKMHVFFSETEVGPVTHKLYDTLCGIQIGDEEAPKGWIVKVD